MQSKMYSSCNPAGSDLETNKQAREWGPHSAREPCGYYYAEWPKLQSVVRVLLCKIQVMA